MFLPTDKDNKEDRNYNEDSNNASRLSIVNKKCIHYNDEVLLPLCIGKVHKELGLKVGWPVAESTKAISWFDGDIEQLRTMMFEAREALDEARRMCRNTHSAAATGTRQPCDVSPVFRVSRKPQSSRTARGDTVVGRADKIRDLLAGELWAKGRTLDGNYRKKRARFDFLASVPELLEVCWKRHSIRWSFVEASNDRRRCRDGAGVRGRSRTPVLVLSHVRCGRHGICGRRSSYCNGRRCQCLARR